MNIFQKIITKLTGIDKEINRLRGIAEHNYKIGKKLESKIPDFNFIDKEEEEIKAEAAAKVAEFYGGWGGRWPM